MLAPDGATSFRVSYQEGYPIVLGFGGEACTGKTSTAQMLAPAARVAMQGSTPNTVTWEHIAFSMPLYELASIRRKTEGDRSYDRMAYAIHDVLVDVFGYPAYGAPNYIDLTTMVHEVCSFPFNPEEEKPRVFLQWLGDCIRELMPTGFTSWMQRKVNSNYAYFRSDWMEASADDDLPPFVVVISDVRAGTDYDFIRKQPNGILVKLTASENVRRQRAVDRDGRMMSESESQHSTETFARQSSDDDYDLVIDTDGISVIDQVELVRKLVDDFVGIEGDDEPDQRRRLRSVE